MSVQAGVGRTGPGGEAPVKETTLATFSADVIAASATVPVLVDFHSPRSPASQDLSAVLQGVVRAAGGLVRLARMNIDEHPQIAQRLGIRTVPAVYAFQRGQPIDGFAGALPEAQVRGFVERLVGPLSDGTEEAVAEAEALLAAGDAAGAAAILGEIVEADPSHLPAHAGLVRALVAGGDLAAARALADTAPAAADKDQGFAAACAALDLAEQAGAVGDLTDLRARLAADADDHQARFDLAIALNGQGRREDAADELLAIVGRDRTWNDDGARKQLLQFFEAWSLMDPVTLSARRKLSGLLFS